jgi:hypothetical protein
MPRLLRMAPASRAPGNPWRAACRLGPDGCDRRVCNSHEAIDIPVESKTMTFDYDAPAELFMAKRKGGSRQPLGYRRFATAAEAIRFAVEDFPAVRTLGAWLQVGDERFDGDAIQRLYDSGNYPLQRRPSN